MDYRDVDIVNHQRGWDGYFKLDVYELRHKQFNGRQSPVIRREVLERGHAVAVLPYDPVRDEVVLIEQFRPATLSVHKNTPDMPAWLIEIVAGIVEPGETLPDVARRETMEESGCSIIGDLELITPRYYASPGCTSETVQIFYGRVDSKNAGGLHGLAEEGEDIRVFTKSSDDCFAMLRDGIFCNAPIIMAMQWLMLHRDRLRREAASTAI
ncbi:NUDIX domain-containing protein [Thalassospira mesophila]|uniref:ADP-ribose pyrophosphatase n=1 Tax=Thalassospira mesophila TaxID=1293891 RepID=A0A1Y2L1B2_9PROT|nr:NUDIX domain-containing protein [Thalassospira mesophila]OSQ38895.1 ADP-ribose pyrophosphatase [Thalassospira mesophila]